MSCVLLFVLHSYRNPTGFFIYALDYIAEYVEALQAFFSCIFRRAIAYGRSLQKWKHLETSCVDKLILYRNTSMLVQMQFPKTNSRGIKVKL